MRQTKTRSFVSKWPDVLQTSPSLHTWPYFFRLILQIQTSNINICYFSRICAFLILLLFKIFVRFTLRRVHELTGINLLILLEGHFNYHLMKIDCFVAGELHRSFLLVVLQLRRFDGHILVLSLNVGYLPNIVCT